MEDVTAAFGPIWAGLQLSVVGLQLVVDLRGLGFSPEIPRWLFFCKLKTHFIEKILEKACRRQCPAPTPGENSVSNCSVPRQQGKVPPGSCEVHTRNLQNSVWDFLHLAVSPCCAPSKILLSRVEEHLEPRFHSAERFTSGDQCVEINTFLRLVSNLLSCFVFLIFDLS